MAKMEAKKNVIISLLGTCSLAANNEAIQKSIEPPAKRKKESANGSKICGTKLLEIGLFIPNNILATKSATWPMIILFFTNELVEIIGKVQIIKYFLCKNTK